MGTGSEQVRSGAGPFRQVEHPQGVSVFREHGPINFVQSSRWLHMSPGVRAPSGLSGHLVQALGAGAHLSQPTSGEGGQQAPPPLPTPQAQPQGSHPCVPGRIHSWECTGGGVTQRAFAHRVSCPGRAEDMSFVQVFFVG